MDIKKTGLALLACAVIAGCGTKEDNGVLSVNGVVLTRGSIENDIENVIKAQGDKISDDQKEYARQSIMNQIVQSFIIETILVEKAKAEGFVVTDADRKTRADEFLKAIQRMPDAPKTIEEYFKKFPLGEERARKEFENGILIDKMIKAEQAKAPKADYDKLAKEEIAAIVESNKKVAEGAKAALAKITGLKAELDKVPAKDLPAKFAELAKANSACNSASKGGELGEFTHGMMVKEFDEAAFKLPLYKVSDPVKTQFGYHLIMSTNKVAAVEAKGDAPAVPEKVQASHILIRVDSERPVPKVEDMVENVKRRKEREFVSGFVMGQVKSAKIVALDDEFKHFVPPADEGEASSVEKSEKK